MSIRQVFQTAISNLRANRLRCLQAMLATVIGVAGVVVVLMGSNSLMNMNTRGYDEIAPASFNAYVEQNAEYPKAVTQADMEQVARDNPEIIKAISPLVWSRDLPLQLRNGDKVLDECLFYGVGESYLEHLPAAYVQDGRFLQYMDISRKQNVCVIGSNIAQELFGGDALGQTLRIWGENYTIVGVLADLSSDFELNKQILVPYSKALEIFGERIMLSYNYYADQYLVVVNGMENVSAAQQLLQNMLREKTGGETGSIYNPTTKWTLYMYAFSYTAELIKGSIYRMNFFGLLAAAIVLLIGGVGIMNVMLAAVQERTKEIGIRKAFGATNKDIERQFFSESVIISLIGGLLGFALGLAVILIAAFGEIIIPVYGGMPYLIRFEDMDLLTFGLPVLVVLLICVGIGVVFGTYPAQQAMKMEIVDVINSD